MKRERIVALDVVRGFALCGILLANVKPIAHVGDIMAPVEPATPDDAWMGLLVEQRFFPIFSLLFGVGFSLLLESAAARVARPRLVLARRLIVLLAAGLAHFFLIWPGDILSTYAVVGLLVLLPSTWLPRAAVAVLAPVLVTASLILQGERFLLVAGLFLLGSALTRYGVTAGIERSLRAPAVLGLAFAALAAPVLWWQTRLGGGDAGASRALALGGLLVAGVYVCGLLVLLRTPLRPALAAVFAPLGRMALTNYLTATVLVLLVARAGGGSADAWSSARVALTSAAVLAVQWLWSTLWLRRRAYGPLEWLWRRVTWAGAR
ncbi:DUF418 domain-containing protein [Microbispora sp. H11081]|uniref:DUF418 domain-containing protein n=1 Tax=Microbispora sp. H11081 TaxID=2729107 RepID=UPI0014754E31|nr:DUF418 domain-containing protein [Microbispora sp. H11081]